MLTNYLYGFGFVTFQDGEFNSRHILIGLTVLAFIGYVSAKVSHSNGIRAMLSFLLGFASSVFMNEIVFGLSAVDTDNLLRGSRFEPTTLLIGFIIVALAFLIGYVYEKSAVKN
jgi:uncharacterized membrane protein